jgi:capsular exopolysaccharide synthesis family protein
MPDSPAPVIEEKREVHLLDYWRIIWRGRWTVLGIFVVVVTLVAIGTFTQKPVYRAKATVEINSQASKVAPVADVSNIGTGNFGWFAEERYFNTQYEIIKSRDVAQRVFDRLDLFNHPTFRKSSDPVGAFARMVQVQPIKDTGIVELSLEGPDPDEVALWVNTTAECYVDRNMDVAVKATGSAVKTLLTEIEPLRKTLEDSQKSSYEYAEKTNLYVPENQEKMTSERLSALQSDLTQAQIKRGEAESLLKEIDSIRQRGGSFESVPQIGGDPVIQELARNKVALEREYERLLLTYKEKHIRVLEKQSEIDKVNEKITAEAEKIINGIKTQYALLRDQESSLKRTMDETRTESFQVTRKSSNYDLIRGQTAETKRIYDLISGRIQEIGLSASLISNNLKILDQSPVPKVPVKPRVLLNMAVGILLGLLLGVGTVFFLDYLDNTVRTSEDIEQFLKLNLLAIVPRQVEGTEGAVREAYQTLRTGLLFSRRGPSQNAVLISSAGPQEGKSCTTINLARTLASAGERTIVVDCDLRRPTIHQRMNVPREPGVTNYILSGPEDDWTNYVRATDQANLSIMTCGPIPPNPAEVFGHERFQRMLKEMREKFDWVFIDSPPVISLADAVILASMTDMVAFVIKHNENDKDLIRRCIANLRKVNPHIIGAVLNNVDLDRSHYKDYYYVGYYYYGESSANKKNRKRTSGLRSAGGARDKSADGRMSRSA